MKKALVYCSKGLGDGLIFLVLSNNLSKNGYKVDTFHPFLSELNGWFKYTKIKTYPDVDTNFEFLNDYDLLVINSDYEDLNKKLVNHAKSNHADKTYELHPSACKGKNLAKGDLKFNPEITVKENLAIFCENDLNFTNVFSSNDITIPSHLKYRKHKKRVVLHPTSNNIDRNWPKKKFLKLVRKLKKDGYEPSFILAPHEKNYFGNSIDIDIPKFNNLEEIASFIHESSFFIGNDSGIAHLASALKIPTLTIFSTRRKQKFWRPSFHIDETVVSWPLLNIKGLRLREKYWKNTISVKRVI
ncbi:MAG: hypothetical protein K1060chlam1_01504, partial [Candidatus Anoxychlamydiales bacterium]|nr:hypothetical protein [Candidatus Anoxychlamydiales bacterium]